MLLFRLCMGNCDEYDNIYQNAVVLMLLMLPTCLIYTPQILSYSVIFVMVHRAALRKRDAEKQTGKLLAVPGLSNSVMCSVTADPPRWLQWLIYIG